MARKLYGVFVGTKWGMTRNKRLAIRTIEKRKEGEVRMMDEPEAASWDATTFRVCSIRIYPTAGEAILPRAIC